MTRTEGAPGEAVVERRFRQLVEGVEAILWEGDPNSLQFTFVSKRGEDVLGYPVIEWLEPDFWVNHLHPDDRDAIASECVAAIRKGQDHELEYRMVAADGRTVWFRDLVRMPRGSDGSAGQMRGVLVNITAQKEAEAEHRRLERQLRQAHKLEAIGRLAGGVAHDFNNILTAIVGNTELLLADAPADLHDDIKEIRRSADRATRLVRQLLAFAREQSGERELLDVNEIVREMEELLRRLIGGDVELLIDLCPEFAIVEADRGQIEQILMNLAINARDAMPNGGTLEVETRTVETDGRTWVGLAVVDSGLGMSAETMERMFDPFFTTKGQRGGTGLGLATVHGIVTQSGGRVVSESAVDRGTRVQVLLPAAKGLSRASVPQIPHSQRRRTVEATRPVRRPFASADSTVIPLGSCGAWR
jgi:two-component system cell cycle sensor histidine kinase/response regulator CckA